MTKQNVIAYYRRYQKSTATTLDAVYKTCSPFKRKAYEEWRQKAHDMGADLSTFRIVSHNSNFFTLGFVVDNVFHFVTARSHYTLNITHYELNTEEIA